MFALACAKQSPSSTDKSLLLETCSSGAVGLWILLEAKYALCMGNIKELEKGENLPIHADTFLKINASHSDCSRTYFVCFFFLNF